MVIYDRNMNEYTVVDGTLTIVPGTSGTGVMPNFSSSSTVRTLVGEDFTSVIIGNGITVIGRYAFRQCMPLTSITIGNNVTTINNYAFLACYCLVEVCNNSSLSMTAGSSSNGYVAYYALNVYSSSSGSSKLHYQTLDDSSTAVYYQNGSATYLVKIKDMNSVVILPDTLGGGSYSIYKYAFYGCTSLTSVTIGNSVTSIGDYAFYYCTSLTSITIGNNVTSIGGSAFDNCTALTSIVIPNSVISIGRYAFRGCSSISSLIIGDNVTSIGSYAFYGCTSLTSATIPSSVSSIGDYAVSGCSSLTSINVASGNRYYSSSGGVLYNHLCTELILYPPGLSGSYIIPNGVSSIGRGAFYTCTFLTSVTIPDSVTRISENAFRYCNSLTTINVLGETPATLSGSNQFPNNPTIIYVPLGTSGTYETAWSAYESQIREVSQSSCKINISGTWHTGTPYVNVNGTWHKGDMYVNVNGTWKKGG